jgi:hypothetical protein
VARSGFGRPSSTNPIAGGADDPLTTVQLELVDARESDDRTIDPAEIGYGIAWTVWEYDPALWRPPHTRCAMSTRDATADALRLARVGVSDHGPRTLVATVKKFWIDGYLGYKGDGHGAV